MRVVLQRVTRASVTVEGRVVGSIGTGLLALVGVRRGDTRSEADWLAAKVSGLRIFSGADAKFDKSLADVGGAVLVVSQFTLHGDARKGRRPDFTASAGPAEAEPLVDAFAEALRAHGHHVETGVFGAMMQVELVNDGPVTLILDRDAP